MGAAGVPLPRHPSTCLTCLAVDARFLQAGDLAGLRAEATRAEAQGAAAVFLREGPLGDPIVLAAGLGPVVPRLLLGVRISLTPAGRHPALLARDATSLDLVCGGRSVLCFAPPFTDDLPEAIALCRALWRAGEVVSEGPCFPVHAAANRARPVTAGSPLVALDLTADELPAFLAGTADLLLRPSGGPAAVCRLERV
jgi:alkanesulfonate monooxygenase SsuD/methylene tetrahydromethanopterin reductase-like flavin-dependent oxidoreductase (luciferase family)